MGGGCRDQRRAQGRHQDYLTEAEAAIEVWTGAEAG